MKVVRALFLVFVLSLGAACAGVPSGSEPVAVRHVDSSEVVGDAPPDIQVVPPGPSKHMSSRDIVDGFLRASSAGVDPRHQVARRFLTPNAAQTWQDTALSTVYTQPLVDDRGSSVTVTAQQLASVAQDGSYKIDRQSLVVRFSLQKIKGEWRIDNPPPGIFVRSSDFAQNFHAANVYFLNPSRNAVVPDPRYFEVPMTSMANRLIQALIAGPSTWLTPAVASDIPKGTILRTNVVDDSPTVKVDLSHLGSLSKAQLKGLSAQIVFTLARFNSSSVRILSDGQPLAVPGVGADQQLPDWQAYDPETLTASAPLYYVQEGAVWNGNGTRTKGPAGIAYYDLSSVGVPVDGTKMAGVSHLQGHDTLFVGPMGGKLVDKYQAPSLTPPSWGGQSAEVWTVGGGDQVLRVPADGQPQSIASPDVTRVGPITALRVSRDGTRVAMIGRGGRLYVARVARTADNVTIDGVFNVSPSQTGFTDVAWAAGDELLALATNGTSSQVPWDILIDGSTRHADGIDTLPAAPSGIAAASDRLTVVSAKGSLWYYNQADWTRVTAPGSDVTLRGTAPVYPD